MPDKLTRDPGFRRYARNHAAMLYAICIKLRNTPVNYRLMRFFVKRIDILTKGQSSVVALVEKAGNKDGHAGPPLRFLLAPHTGILEHR